MKRFLIYIAALVVMAAGGYFLVNEDKRIQYITKLKYHPVLHNPCEDTIEYSVGSVDSNFDIKKSKLKNTLKSVEDVWEAPLGHNFFEYTTSSDFKINLVYDERQSRTEQKKKIESDLSKTQQKLNDLDQRYKQLKLEYQSTKEEYEKITDKLDQQSKEYNQKVSEYNQKGGAPPEKYRQLQEEREDLNKLRQEVDSKQQEVSKLSQRINKIAEESNKIIQQHNEKVETYKDKFGETRQFNAGEYNGFEINIYRFRDMQDLKLTIAHEFGHALGLKHVKNVSSAIMYHLMGGQNLNNIKLTDADINLLNSECD